MNIPWSSKFIIGVPIIDEQHKHFIDTLNTLYAVIEAGADKNKIIEVFQELDKYVYGHFSTEENFFDKYDYPEREEHKAEHKKFTTIIQNSRHAFDNDPLSLSVQLVETLELWLIEHIEKVDKRYIPFFKEHGLV